MKNPQFSLVSCSFCCVLVVLGIVWVLTLMSNNFQAAAQYPYLVSVDPGI